METEKQGGRVNNNCQNFPCELFQGSVVQFKMKAGGLAGPSSAGTLIPPSIIITDRGVHPLQQGLVWRSTRCPVTVQTVVVLRCLFSPWHVCRGFPVQRVGKAELGNDFKLILGLSGEPGRLLKLKRSSCSISSRPPKNLFYIH